MTSADDRHAPASAYPWHEHVGAAVGTLAARSTVVGSPAGPVTRSLANVADLVVVVLGLGVQAVYVAVTWAVVGETDGDRLLRLRLTDDRGSRLGWGRCALRAVCTNFPIGLQRVLVSGENRSVQDAVLRTSVVYD